MDRGRRRALSFVGSAPLFLASGIGSAAAGRTPRDRPIYFSAYGALDGAHGVAAFGADGGKVLDAPLPARAHGIAVHPDGDEAVAFARRPGTFAAVLRRRDGAGRARLDSPPGRHFCGHGVYSADGEFLFTTENDFDAGRGVVGVWRTRPRYRRAREFPSHGIGPHELILSGDGATLIVANGGILTHPDTGRRKLNVPTMSPSLAYVDSSDGRLVESRAFGGPRRRLLGIRHLAVAADGLVCLALQDEGPRGDPLPLVAFHRPGDAEIDLRPAPRAILRRMKGYTGSAAADSSGAYLAVTAPRGGMVAIWDVRRREPSAAFDLADGCGVAPEGRPGRFLATSGAGGAALLDAATGRAAAVGSRFLARRRWDNHLARAPGRAPGRGV